MFENISSSNFLLVRFLQASKRPVNAQVYVKDFDVDAPGTKIPTSVLTSVLHNTVQPDVWAYLFKAGLAWMTY